MIDFFVLRTYTIENAIGVGAPFRFPSFVPITCYAAQRLIEEYLTEPSLDMSRVTSIESSVGVLFLIVPITSPVSYTHLTLPTIYSV